MNPHVRCMILPGTALATLLVVLILQAVPPPQTGPQTEKRFPPLKVPPGFKATLFACDPLIEYPSVISIGPRPGAIFVAYDYMTGLGLEHVRRDEIRMVEDTDGDGYADKASVFATGFNSIQGMAYHDGAVFVMHAPFLTVLRDTKKTGVADERKDLLTGLGLTPENNKALLHCANGIAVGHDGWLYLAMGDNGVNVMRPEGDRLTLNGGGILRCRPDGRDLHVFSTGLRDIYDIALDAELNVFVRDNENDGGTYMIRVCHSFHGADHGYPYLYGDYPDEALPPLGDFGLGSSAGGACYLEAQFPDEYRGNLFFCEWGKSVVRYPLTRAGSGFASVKEFEFATGDRKDTYPFKPTDIVVQRDGTMMIADFADGQRPKRGRGRIYHVAYVGKDAETVKQKQAPAPTSRALDSESYYERYEAQAKLERDGKTPIVLGPSGRMHALWALAHKDGTKAIDELMRIAASDPDTGVRTQAVRAVADLTDPILNDHKLDAGPGDAKRAEQLAALAKGQGPRVMLEIVVALGRLRWPGAGDWLRDNLVAPDRMLSHAAMQMLRRSANWPAILRLLDQPDELPLRAIALRALSDRHEPHVVDGLIARLSSEKSAERRRAYAEMLTRVYKKPGPWKYWGYRPGPKPANTEKWDRTAAIEAALDRAFADFEPAARFAVLKRMQREKVPADPARLGHWLASDHQTERAAAILAVMSEQAAPDFRPFLRRVIRDPQHSSANRLTALALLFKNGNESTAMLGLAQGLEDGPVLAEVLRRLGDDSQIAGASVLVNMVRSPDAEVRAAAIQALGQLRADEGRPHVLPLLLDRDARVRRAAAAAAGKLALKESNEPLLKLMADDDAMVRFASLESLRLLQEPRAIPLAVSALNEPMLQKKALETLGELGGPEQAGPVVDFAKRSPSAELLAITVRVLTKWRDRENLSPSNRAQLDRAVADVHGASGMLLRWHTIGPFADGDRAKLIELAVGKALPAERISLAGGAEGRVVLSLENQGGPLLFLARTDVSAVAQTPVEFLASSRGGFQVWLNGQSIYQRERPGNYVVDSDRFAGTLDKGNNQLVVLTSSENVTEFHVRFRRKSEKAEHEKLTLAALSRSGNMERGRKIFFDKEKSQCIKCHQIGNLGERIGPELTGVGGRFSRIHLVEAILEPSRAIAPSFDTWVVTLKSGKAISGVKVAETETALILADNQGQKQTLQKAEIEEQHLSTVSSMPEGLERRFTEDEFVDLIAFLAAQKNGR